MDLSGKSTIILHIGHPTHSFKAPLIYNPWFQHHDLDVMVVPLGIKPENFATVFPGLMRSSNITGALITMPYKVQVLDLIDEVSTTATIAGAANAVRVNADGTLAADMFDGEGFVRGVTRQVQGTSALVVGSGGVGSAIAASLANSGTSRLGVFDALPESAEALALRLQTHYPELQVSSDSNDPAGYDIVVNATPLGMNPGDPMPLDIDRLDPSTYVGEVVMKQEMTPFLQAAQARGCEVQIGTAMLFEQIPAYLEFFGLGTTTADELRALARIEY